MLACDEQAPGAVGPVAERVRLELAVQHFR